MQPPRSPGPPTPSSGVSTPPAGVAEGRPAGSRSNDDLRETLFEQAPLGMVVFDDRLHVVRANTALAEMLGVRPADLVARSLTELTHPEDRRRSAEAIDRLLRRELSWVTIQKRLLGVDGQARWGELATRIFWSEDGRFLHGLGIVRDIDDVIRAETALRESEIRNWRITESNMMGLFEWRDPLTISEANDAFLQMLGYTREDLRAGRIQWSRIIPPGSEELTAQLREQMIATGRIPPTRTEYLARDGQRIPVLAGGARISWDPVRGIGFVLDMSEQRKVEDERARVELALRESLAELQQAQAQLQLADRMAAMGTLASGVAHEINNPLGFVVANLGFVQEEIVTLRSQPPDQENLDKRLAGLAWALGEAQEGAKRVRDIVRDLRTFSHPDTEARRPVDICRVIDAAVNLAQGEIRGQAKVVRRYQPVLPVDANEVRLSQLFLNLIVNAAHSIATASRAVREGKDAAKIEHEIRLRVAPEPDGRVRVEVADTGGGIPPEHLDRVFDPFFTRIPTGLRSGLGLSICHGIVRSLGGEIGVQSTLGVGSSFHVLLPAAAPGETGPAAPKRPAEAEDQPSGRRARILVVDDEPLMGSAIGRVLAEHEVVALTSARAALARIDSGERFDVILCDVMMPEFSGIDLYDAIAARAPELLSALVFVTGGAYTPEAISFLERIPNLRLEKPILPEALHGAVALALASTAARPA